MLDLNNENDRAAYESLSRFLKEPREGLNFCLAMRQDDGSVSIHHRFNQPCQGGEMRKYKKTHGNACTRPNDPRPGDLEDPFPKGTVEAVAVLFATEDKEFVEAGFSEDSPWINGFSSPECVTVTQNIYGEVGILLNETDIDPTVLVNLLQLMQYSTYQDWITAGFSRRESLMLTAILPTSPGNVSYSTVGAQTYHFGATHSIRRFVESNPQRFGENTWRDGEDYNRPEIQDLFAPCESSSLNLPREIYNRGFPKPLQNQILGYKLSEPAHGYTEWLALERYPTPAIKTSVMRNIDYSKPIYENPVGEKPTWDVLVRIVRDIIDEEYNKWRD